MAAIKRDRRKSWRRKPRIKRPWKRRTRKRRRKRRRRTRSLTQRSANPPRAAPSLVSLLLKALWTPAHAQRIALMLMTLKALMLMTTVPLRKSERRPKPTISIRTRPFSQWKKRRRRRSKRSKRSSRRKSLWRLPRNDPQTTSEVSPKNLKSLEKDLLSAICLTEADLQ